MMDEPIGGEIPKFDTGTRAILKFDTSTHHYLKIDTRHAIEATHDTCLFYLRQTTPHPSDTKIDNIGYHFFREAKPMFRVNLVLRYVQPCNTAKYNLQLTEFEQFL